MNNFQKRVLAIKELYPKVICNNGNQGFDENGDEVSMNETTIANKIAEMDTVRNQEQTDIENNKTSATNKLKELGLTDDEIKAIKEVV